MTSGCDTHGEVRAVDLSHVIVLLGFMGAGKSSVGRALSARLGWPFLDLDERIQLREGRSIEQIFKDSGEIGFRKAEHAELRELLMSLDSTRAVLALGGGTFAQRENLALLKLARTVFLDAGVEELLQRCVAEARTRPLLKDAEQFRQLYESRRDSYLGASLHIETSGKDVETVVTEIVKCLEV